MALPVPVPFVHSVVHPTDFSDGSDAAFAHALAIALIRRGELTLLHGGSEPANDGEWSRFPPVRKTLERWGVIEPGVERAELSDKVSLGVRKVDARGPTPLAAVDRYLEEHAADLLVLGTEGREGLARFLRPSAAQRLARRAGTRTLFVPAGIGGFVEPEDGSITLRRIVVPVDQRPDPTPAVIVASRAAAALSAEPVDVTLLHVGDGDAPPIKTPETASCRWHTLQRWGDPAREILAACEELGADLVVMATEGREGIVDALRGSVTEQVVRNARSPVLAVPAE